MKSLSIFFLKPRKSSLLLNRMQCLVLCFIFNKLSIPKSRSFYFVIRECTSHARIQKVSSPGCGGGGGGGGVSSDKKPKYTNISGSSLARQRNAISMAFRSRDDDDPVAG